MTATNEIKISDITTKLGDASGHYQKVAKDGKNLREAFYEAGQGLSLVKKALQNAETLLDKRDTNGYPKGVKVLLDKCKINAQLSKSIFQAVAQAPETSRIERYKEAVTQEGKGKTVEVLVKDMMDWVCELTKKAGIEKEMKDEVGKLLAASQKLSTMKPSVPTEESGDTYNNWGSGDMMNAPGGRAIKNDFHGANISGFNF